MKIKKTVFLVALVAILVSSCSKEYYDTKEAGETYLADLIKKGNVDLYETKYDTTLVTVYTPRYDSIKDANDSLLQIDTVMVPHDSIANIAASQVFYKNAEIKKLSNDLNYAVFWDNPYGIYPQFADPLLLNIQVRYTVYFIDGTLYKPENRDPTIFSVSTTTETFWEEVIPKMRIGSKWRIWVPYAYAYTEEGVNEKSDGSYDIDPYTLLIYDVELINAY